MTTPEDLDPATSEGGEPTKYVPQGGRSASQWASMLGIILIHGFTVYAFWRGFTWKLVLLAVLSYFVRMFAITGAYHRYFSHRTYKTSRVFQFFLALLGVTATQKGPIWWASTHRHHHKYSDQEHDVHSPLRRGFIYSHMGWWLGREHENTNEAIIQDFTKYPELRFLDRFHMIGPFLLIGILGFAGGTDAILWGYVVSTCFLAHGTFTINSLSHVFGSRRFATTDTSRNNLLLALITMGEGWHNNHHHYMSSANQGFYWWEIDVTYYILKGLEKVGIVWDVRGVPESALKRNLLSEVGEKCELLLPASSSGGPPPEKAEAPLPVAAAIELPSLADAE